jgi:hypothetical protein
MPFHLHTIRSCCGAALGVILAVALLGAAYRSPKAPEWARVTGRVSCAGRPVGGMLAIFEPADLHNHEATSPVGADGSFRVEPRDDEGLVPGTYRVFFHRPGRARGGDRPEISRPSDDRPGGPHRPGLE